jgi:hypothetical protein
MSVDARSKCTVRLGLKAESLPREWLGDWVVETKRELSERACLIMQPCG